MARTRSKTRKAQEAEMLMPPDEHHHDPRVAARYADQNARIANLRDSKVALARLVQKLATGNLHRSERSTIIRERDEVARRIREVEKDIAGFEEAASQS